MQNKNKQSAKISRNLKFIVLSLVFLLFIISIMALFSNNLLFKNNLNKNSDNMGSDFILMGIDGKNLLYYGLWLLGVPPVYLNHMI